MLLNVVLPTFLLAITAVNSKPLQLSSGEKVVEERDDHNLHGEMVRFKRDAVPEPRDLELAELHQINLTEMYKHSVMKRDDGDHVTLWVHNAYVEAEGPEQKHPLTKRQRARLGGGASYLPNGNGDLCGSHDRKDWTSANSPTTGGIIAMRQWGWDNDGWFPYGDHFEREGWGWRTLLVAGSNGGTNVQYRAQFIDGRRPEYYSGIGTRDLAADSDFALSRARNFNGQWRAASYGWESCRSGLSGYTSRANYEVARFNGQV